MAPSQKEGPVCSSSRRFHRNRNYLFLLLILTVFLPTLSAHAVPSLDITKLLVDPPGGIAVVGDTVTFEIILDNSGSTTVTSLPLTDTYDPACLEYLSADPADNVEIPGFIYWSNLGPLAPGHSDTIAVTFWAIAPCGMTLDTASTCDAQDEHGDPVPTEEDIAGVVIVQPQIRVNKILIDPPGGTAAVGDTVAFAVLVENTGTTDISNVPLHDLFDPDCLSFLGATTPPNQALSGLLVWCCIGPVAAGETDTITIYFSADHPCGVTIDTVRTSGVFDEYGFPVPDDEDIAAVNIVELDLMLTKSVLFPPGGQVELGDSAVFRIVLHNGGTSDITFLPLTDLFTAGCLEYDWADPVPDGITDSVLTWTNLGPLPAGSSDTIYVALTADSLCPAAGDTALVTGAEDEFGLILPDLSATASIEILHGVLILTKNRIEPVSDYAAVGETVCYDIILENSGTSVIDSVPLTDSFDPSCFILLTADPPQDDSLSGLIRWTDLGPLLPGESDTVHLCFEAVSPCGLTVDTALVSGATDELGATLADLQDTAFVRLVLLDLDVTKTRLSPTGSAGYGDTVIFRILFTNSGSSTITTLPLTDTYAPSCLQFLSADPIESSSGSGWISWNNLGPLAGGSTTDSVIVSFRAIGPCGVTVDTALVNGAEDEFGLFLPDEEDTALVDLQMPLLEVYKVDGLDGDSDGNGVPSPGDTLLYTVTLTNTGNDPATGVAFVDTPGVYTSLVVGSVTTTSGVITSGNSPGDDTVGVDIGTIAASASDVITFQVVIDTPLPPDVARIANQGFALSTELLAEPSDDPDTVPGDDSTATSLTINPELDVTKSDAIVGDLSPLGYANPGDTLEYTIIFTNDGNSGVSGVAFIDTPDVRTELIVGSVITTAGGVIVGNTPGDDLIWVSMGVIDGGGTSDTVSFRVTIDAPLPYGTTQIENQGLASSAQLGTEPTDDPATGATDDPTKTTLIMPEFEITKTDSFFADADGNGVLSPLDTMFYRIIVENTDSIAALNVTVIDTPGAYISLVPGSVTTTWGSVILGNFAWDWFIRVDAATLPADSIMTITFLATVDCLCPLPFGGVSLENQAWLRDARMTGQVSDDPDTPTPNDPTLTSMNGYEIFIEGAVTYYSNGEPVPDVVITLSGDGEGLTVTDGDGEYRLSSFTNPELCTCHDYVLEPYKLDNPCDAVNDFDESLVIRYVTGEATLTPLQMMAADVSGNGTVSMWDATLIAQFSVGIIHTFPAGDWVFIPSEIVYADLDSVQTGADFIGILLGDVSGDWEPCIEIPEAAVSPPALEMTLTEGQVGVDTVFVCNAGPGVLSYTVSESTPVPWLMEFPAWGAVVAYRCDTILVTFNATSLTPGDYYTSILIDSNDPDDPQATVTVHLEVLAGIPDITLIPTSFTKVLSEGESTVDILSICNDGNGTLTFTLSEGVPWLGENLTGGTVSATLCQEVIITFNAMSLSSGNYFTSILVASDDPDEPVVSVGVSLQVLEILEPDISVSPPSLSETLPEGGGGSTNLLLSNDGTASLTYTIAESGGDVPWLSVFPASGSISAGDDALVTVTFTAASLTAGSYSAALNISSNDPDEPLVAVPVVLTVNASGPCLPLGDVDGNGDINVLDVVLLANIILEIHTPTAEELCRADCNQDTDPNVLDLVAIVNVILGTGTCPPAFGAKAVNPEANLTIPAELAVVGGRGVLPLSVANDVDLSGLQFTISYDPDRIQFDPVRSTARTAEMTVGVNDMTGRAVVLVYSSEGVTLAPGTGAAVSLPFRITGETTPSEPVLITIEESILAVNCCQAVTEGGMVVILKTDDRIPREFSLSQNYPNPFNPTTTISYQLSAVSGQSTQHTTLKIYNIMGQEVATLVDEVKDAGYYEVQWDASELASGIYFYRLTAGEFTQTRRMVLMK